MTDIAEIGFRVDTSGILKGKRALDGLDDAAKKTEKSAQGLTSKLSVMGGILSGLAAGAIAGLIGQYTKLADEYNNTAARLNLLTGSTQAAARVQKELYEIAQRTRGPLGATNDLYIKLGNSTKSLGLSQKQTLRMTETINKAFVVSGAGAVEAENAIRQLGQGLASGALRGDEFNSIAEQAPILMDMFAESLGVTRDELRALAADGKITSEVIVNALGQGAADIDAKFAKMPVTVGQAFTMIRNAIGQAVGEFEQMTGIASKIATVFQFLANHLREMAVLLAGVAVGMYAAFGPSIAGLIATATAAVKGWTLALLANPIGLIAGTVAAAAAALVIYSDKIKVAEGSTVSLANVTGDLARTFTSRLAEGASMAGDAIVDMYMRSEAAAKQSATGQESWWVKLLRAVLVALDAIGAASLSIIRAVHITAANLIGSIRNMAQTVTDIVTAAKAGSAEGMMAAAQAGLARFKDAGKEVANAWSKDIADIFTANLEGGLAASMDESISKRMAEASKATGDASGGGNKPAVGPDKETLGRYQELLASMGKQVDLGTKATEVEKLQWEMRKGNLKGLTKAQQEELLAIAAKIDAQKESSHVTKKAAKEAQDAAKQANDSADQMIASLRRELALKKDATDAEKLKYEVERGSLVGLSPDREKLLTQLTAEAQKRREAAEAAEKYKQLMESIKTPEERKQDQIKEGLGTIAGAGLPQEEREAATSKFAKSVMGDAAPQVRISWMPTQEEIDAAKAKQQAWFDERMAQIGTFRATEASLTAQWDAMELEAKQAHANAMAQIDIASMQMRMDALQGFGANMTAIMGAVYGEQSKQAKAAFAMQKAFAIAEVLLNARVIASNAEKALSFIPVVGPALGKVAGIAAVAAQLAAVAKMKSISPAGMAHDGIDSVPKTGTWLLEKGERVTTSDTSAKLDRTLDRVNERLAANDGGGKGGGVNMGGVTIVQQGRADRLTPEQNARELRKMAVRMA